jgi:ComF family protein
LLSAIGNLSGTIFSLVFPDECRLCEQPLRHLSSVPVCPSCLLLPQPLQAASFCRFCRTPFVDSYPLDEYDLCTVCRESQVNFDATYSFGSYEGPLRNLIHLFKYAKIESLALPLSRFLIRAMPLDQRFDVIMAMPMHWRKRWERGFNQADLLARPLAKRYGVKLATNLRRRRYTRSQAGLTQTQRQENLKNSFCVRKAEQIAGKRVLLVDDVLTTGATLRAAASALKAARAAHVSALTLARVDRRRFHDSLDLRERHTGKAVVAGGVN